MDTNDPRYPAGPPSAMEPDSASTSNQASARAGEVASEARGEVAHVADEAMQQTTAVVHQAEAGVRDIVDEARRAVHDEADRQTHTVSSGVRTLADDLQRMAGASDGETPAADYIGRLGHGLGTMADRLDDGGIDGAMEEARRVARQHPGMFLTGAALGGFALARVLRHAEAPSGNGSAESSGARREPTEGVVTPYGESQMRTGSVPADVDLRDDYERRPGDAPQLREDMQEWVRP